MRIADALSPRSCWLFVPALLLTLVIAVGAVEDKPSKKAAAKDEPAAGATADESAAPFESPTPGDKSSEGKSKKSKSSKKKVDKDKSDAKVADANKASEESDKDTPDDKKSDKKKTSKKSNKDKSDKKAAKSTSAKGKSKSSKDKTDKIDHSGDGRVYDKSAGLSLVPPAGWQRATAKQNDRLRFFAPTEEVAQTGMFVTVTKDDGVAFDKFVESLKEQMPRILQGWKLTSEGAVELEGRPAYFIASSFQVQDSEPHQLQYFLRGDAGNFYTVTFTTDKGSYSKFKKAFQDCAKTVRCD